MGDSPEIIYTGDEKGKDLHKKRSSDEHLLKIKSELNIPFKKARYAWQIKKSNVGSQPCKHASEGNIDDMACPVETANKSELKLDETVSEVQRNKEQNTETMPPESSFGSDDSKTHVSKISCDMETNAFSEVSNKSHKEEDVLTLDNVIPKVSNAFCCFRGVAGIAADQDNCSEDESDSDTHDQITCNPDALQEEVRLQVLQSCFNHNAGNNRTILEASYLRHPGNLRVGFQAPLFDNERMVDNHLGGSNCLWQKQEIACSIVDNVFNHTLEEMGISPDPKINRLATQRLTLEDQSIQAVIRHQGLQVLGHWDRFSEGAEAEVPDTLTSDNQESVHTEPVSDTSFENEMEVEFINDEQEVNDAEFDESGNVFNQCDKKIVDEKHGSSVKDSVENPCFQLKSSHQSKPVSSVTVSRDDNQLGDATSVSMFSSENGTCPEPRHKLSATSSSRGSEGLQSTTDSQCLVPEDLSFRSNDPFKTKSSLREQSLLTSVYDGLDESSNVLDLAVSTAILTQGLTMGDSVM